MRHNLAVLDVFVEVMKMMNHPRLWDAKLAWYSQCATSWICLNSLDHDLRIHGFRPCLIIKILATQTKFLEPSDYWTVINCTFPFCSTLVFDCFSSVMARFKIVKHKFLNLTALYVHLCSFQIAHGVMQCTMFCIAVIQIYTYIYMWKHNQQ